MVRRRTSLAGPVDADHVEIVPDGAREGVEIAPAMPYRVQTDDRLAAPLARRTRIRGAKLAPAWGTPERYELIDALHYLATEVHKHIFHAVISPPALDSVKAEAKALFEPTLSYISRRLGDREVLVGDHFTVADAYLVTLLNWFRYLGADLARWPNIDTYHQRHLAPVGQTGGGRGNGRTSASSGVNEVEGLRRFARGLRTSDKAIRRAATPSSR